LILSKSPAPSATYPLSLHDALPILAGGALAEDAGAAPDSKTYFPLVLSSDLYASPQPQRLVFALSHGGAKGIQYASGPSVAVRLDRKSTRLNSSHGSISYAVFCLKK